jgi:hypothetical protein
MLPLVITHLAFLLHLLTILAAATGLALWAGWGLTRLALPAPLHLYRWLFVPLIGYALVVLVGYWCVRTIAGLATALVILAALTSATNALAWRRTGPPRFPTPGSVLPLGAVLTITLLIGIAPLLHYGHPAIIGGGWDPENYLPTARYLMRGPVSAIAQAPPNPLRDLNSHPPAIGLTLGFSIWQGCVDLLTGGEALASFAPLLAWLRALGVLAVFVTFHATLGLSRWPALVGAAWASAGGLLLWVTYFNFGMQLAAWPLLPLALTLGTAAVQDVAARGQAALPGMFIAAIALAALVIAYYPAFCTLVLMATGIGLADLARSRTRIKLVGGAFALGALTLLIAAPTVLDYLEGFNFRYSHQLTSLGLFHYILPSDILGLTPFSLAKATPLPRPVVTFELVAIAGLAITGLLLGEQRGRWLGLTLGTLAFLAWLRWGIAYPYAYMKAAAYVGWVFLGLAAAGGQALAQQLPRSARTLAALPALTLLAALGQNQQQIVAAHTERPGLYGDLLPDMLHLRGQVPSGSTVTLTDDPRVQGVKTALAAYLLDHTTVLGRVRTGYSASSFDTADRISEYALLHAHEDPAPWGYQHGIWRGGSYTLYKRSAGTLAHLRLEHSLAPDAVLPISVEHDRLSVGRDPLKAGPQAQRHLAFNVAAMEASTLQIGAQRFAFPAGLSTIYLSDYRTPQQLQVRNLGRQPVLIRSLTLTDPVAPADTPLIPAGAAGLVKQARVTHAGMTVTTEVRALLPDSGPLVLALDIWDKRRGVQYGWYGVVVEAQPAAQTVAIALDLPTGAARAYRGDGTLLPLGASFRGHQPGTFVAQLRVGADSLSLLPPTDLFEFDIAADGTLTVLWTVDTPILATATARPVQSLDVRVGGDVRLQGYTMSQSVLRPGDTLECVIWWQAERGALDERSVMVHLLNARGERVAQADGPPASGVRPTSQWRSAELIIDARQVALPANLRPGEYTLLIGMYRWPSLERVSLHNGATRQHEDVLRIPITIRR